MGYWIFDHSYRTLQTGYSYSSPKFKPTSSNYPSYGNNSFILAEQGSYQDSYFSPGEYILYASFDSFDATYDASTLVEVRYEGLVDLNGDTWFDGMVISDGAFKYILSNQDAYIDFTPYSTEATLYKQGYSVNPWASVPPVDLEDDEEEYPEPTDPGGEIPADPTSPQPATDTSKATNRADVLKGGSGKDVISGLAGNDRIHGNGGNDSLRGNGGHDKIHGGDGDDTLKGDGGNDTLKGNGGADVLLGGAGKDTLNGGAGDDLLKGEGGKDRLHGEQGDDKLTGGSGNDALFGGAGADMLMGQSGKDKLSGGGGDDQARWGEGGRRSLREERKRHPDRRAGQRQARRRRRRGPARRRHGEGHPDRRPWSGCLLLQEEQRQGRPHRGLRERKGQDRDRIRGEFLRGSAHPRTW